LIVAGLEVEEGRRAIHLHLPLLFLIVAIVIVVIVVIVVILRFAPLLVLLQLLDLGLEQALDRLDLVVLALEARLQPLDLAVPLVHRLLKITTAAARKPDRARAGLGGCRRRSELLQLVLLFLELALELNVVGFLFGQLALGLEQNRLELLAPGLQLLGRLRRLLELGRRRLLSAAAASALLPLSAAAARVRL
jgi:hypothetical protein